jgi:hypothetical protein
MAPLQSQPAQQICAPLLASINTAGKQESKRVLCKCSCCCSVQMRLAIDQEFFDTSGHTWSACRSALLSAWHPYLTLKRRSPVLLRKSCIRVALLSHDSVKVDLQARISNVRCTQSMERYICTKPCYLSIDADKHASSKVRTNEVVLLGSTTKTCFDSLSRRHTAAAHDSVLNLHPSNALIHLRERGRGLGPVWLVRRGTSSNTEAPRC